MERSLFPNNVLVTQTDLKRTETTKSEQIMQNRVDFTSRGLESGGAITVNVTNTDRVDVAAFTGYTPRGDYIVGDVSTSNIPMSDSTNGVVNVICGVYTETNTKSKPLEDGTNTAATAAEAAFRISVYTQAEFDNPAVLVPTDDLLSNDALDRVVVLGKVTANGASVALTTASIQSPTVFSDKLYATPSSPAALAGVDISYVYPDTATGTTGLLEYNYSAPNYQFRWTPPGGTVGAYVSTSVDATLTLKDGSLDDSIQIQVAVSQLPITGTFPMSATIAIVDLYGQQVPRLTAEDTLHRNKVGTGILSPTNPHALSLDDISGETLTLLDEHQDVMHCNGIWKGSLSTCLSTTVTPAAGYDILYVNAPATNDLYYINGKKLNSIDTNTITYNFLGTSTYLTEVYVTDEETLHAALKASYPGSRTVRGTWIINMSDSYPAASYNLQLVVSGTTPNIDYTFTWDAGAPVVLEEGDDDQAIRLFAKNGVDYIDLWVRCSVLGATDAHLPSAAATYIDSITVASSVSWDDNLHIASVPYWYDALAIQGKIGYPSYSGSRSNVDRRDWGTICKDNLNDAALQELIYHPNDEYEYSGVALYRDVGDSAGASNFDIDTSGASLDVYVRGGSCYLRGQRFTVVADPALTLAASKTHLIYVDDTGTIASLNVTDSFSANKQSAIDYLLGNGADRLTVSEDYHGTLAAKQSPERGLPLWFVVTSGAGVTSSQDVMRNINHVSDNWSVGTEGCAFTSIEAAIYYANAFIQEDLEITVRGSVVVVESFTQPSHVKIKGLNKNHRVTLTLNAASATGAWKLSSGSVVENIFIDDLFLGTGTYFFGLNTDVRIENCLITAPDNYVFADQTVANVDNVVIKDCEIECEALTKAADFGAATFSNWQIKNNVITNTDSTTESIIQEVLDNSVISGNTFTITNTNNFKIGINQNGVSRLLIEGNTFFIDAGDQTTIEQAVMVQASDFVTITSNYFTRASGSASKATTGLNLYGSSNSILVTDNTFYDINIGVYALAIDGEGYSIDGNTFKDMETSAVYISANGNIDTFNIINNIINGVDENSSTLAFMNYVKGIYFKNTGGTLFDNIKISGNSLSTLASASTVSTLYGIEVDLSSASVIYNLKVKDNLIKGISYTGNYGGAPCAGISVEVDVTSRAYYSVDSNTISNIAAASTYFYGIYTNQTGSGSQYVCSCKNNTLSYLAFIDNTGGSGQSNGGIYHDTATLATAVLESSGNEISALCSYPLAGSNDPVGLTVDTGYNDARVSDNIIKMYPAGTSVYYGVHGILVKSVSSSVVVSNNKVENLYGAGIWMQDTTPNLVEVLSNDVISQLYGLLAAGNCRVKANSFALDPGPGATNDLPTGSACVSLVSTGWLEYSGNTTLTTDTSATVGGGSPNTNHSYHVVATLSDDGTASSSFGYTFDSNYFDLKSQGGTPSMSGLYIIKGGTWTVASAHVVKITNNNFVGGAFNPRSPVFPSITSGDEPYVIWGNNLSGSGRAYVLGANTTSPTATGGAIEANIGFDDLGAAAVDWDSLGTNFDTQWTAGPLLGGGSTGSW